MLKDFIDILDIIYYFSKNMTRNDVIHEKTVAEFDTPDHLNCEKWKLNAVNNNKIVKNIISKIESQKFKFDSSCISCEFCPNSGL